MHGVGVGIRGEVARNFRHLSEGVSIVDVGWKTSWYTGIFQDEAVILKEMRVEKRRSIVYTPLPLGGAWNQAIQCQDSTCLISVLDAEQSELCPWMSRAGVRATFRLSPLLSCNRSRFSGDHMTQTSFRDAFHIIRVQLELDGKVPILFLKIARYFGVKMSHRLLLMILLLVPPRVPFSFPPKTPQPT
jgi:hypothetical protein